MALASGAVHAATTVSITQIADHRAQECQVAALSRKFAIALAAFEEDESVDFEDEMLAIAEMAPFYVATSAEGVLFQLAIASSDVDGTRTGTTEERRVA